MKVEFIERDLTIQATNGYILCIYDRSNSMLVDVALTDCPIEEVEEIYPNCLEEWKDMPIEVQWRKRIIEVNDLDRLEKEIINRNYYYKTIVHTELLEIFPEGD